MAEKTLQDYFGANATQTATTITIYKSDLANEDLTPLAENTGDQIAVAVVRMMKNGATETGFNANIDQSTIVSKGLSRITYRGTNNTPYTQTPYEISFSKPMGDDDVNPMDY